MGVDRADHTGEGADERVRIDGFTGMGDRLGELGCRAGGFAVDEGDENTGQVAELLVEDGTGDARGLGDAVRGGRVEALGGHDGVGDVEDLLAAALSAHPPAYTWSARHP